MENFLDTLGGIIKAARLKSKITQKDLAAEVGITPRFVMSIENEGRNLSLELFVRIVRTLHMETQAIFYPETQCTDSDKDQLIRMIQLCDERSFKVVEATVKALLENQ